jgi:hypothetical protein
MKKINRPNYTSSDVLNSCIESKRRREVNADFVGRLEQITPTVANNEINYINLATTESLHIIEAEDNIDGIISAKEMVNLYDNTFVKSTVTRHIYDTIRSATQNEECPFCSQRKVSTLDHYLPKSDHPLFAVTPCNLLPSCSECNKAKFTYQSENANDQLIHPYFDELNNDRWLYADVIEASPPALAFRVDPPENWSSLKRARIVKHFELLKLGKLYSANAGSELAGMEYKLRIVFEGNGSVGVQSRLSEDAESWFIVHRNCWQGAMYEALSNSDWFCSVMFFI